MFLTMTGRLADTVLLTYRAPAGDVRPLLPPGLEPVTDGLWGYWGVVACRIEAMRPAGFPRWMGLSYRHIAYRVHVRLGSLEGLYFVRSDVSSRPIAGFGNIVTDFRLHRARVRFDSRPGQVEVDVETGGSADVLFRARDDGVGPIPPDGLAYKPLGFAPCRDGWRLSEVLRDRAAWEERPLTVLRADFGFFAGRDVHLVRATRVAPIEYVWRLGRRLPAEADTPSE